MTEYTAIVLAAGAANRYGGGKLLADWRGRPLIVAAVEAALAAPVDDVLVVLGCDGDRIAAALDGLAGPRLRRLHAANWSDGMSASLKAGVAGLGPRSRGFLLFLGDMPLIPAGLAARVLQALAAGATAAQPFFAGTPAHPVGVSALLYEDLMRLQGDRGAAGVLRGRDDVVRFEVEDAGAVFDIDTIEDRDGRMRSGDEPPHASAKAP